MIANTIILNLLFLEIEKSIDELVIYKKEQIIEKYLSSCKNSCTFYFKEKNVLEQKYTAFIYHNENSEKCISIYNKYFDPILNIDKCGNEKINVYYRGYEENDIETIVNRFKLPVEN